MQVKLLHVDAERTYAVVFEEDDEVIQGLTRFANEESVTGAQLIAVGAFRDVVLGYFDVHKKAYTDIPVEEQVEVLSLVGNIGIEAESEEPKVHAHVVVGKADGTALGGHLREGHVRPTLEVIVTETPEYLQRRVDEKTGLALIDL